MRFEYCPKCGRKAALREIGDEGLMPYCEGCERPLFDLFPVCVLCAVTDGEGSFALIRQSYVNAGTFVGVAGYIKSGESAEAAAEREVREETGLTPFSVKLLGTYPYAKKDMLMIGFLVTVRRSEFALSGEVDQAQWFTPEEAVKAVREGSIIQQVLLDAIDFRSNE
ncbi:MAG: NUDIX domain-containing protein [Ruminococcus sp.]|nr:NUDIX domain-containing protein [Ruminococcus sp.]